MSSRVVAVTLEGFQDVLNNIRSAQERKLLKIKDLVNETGLLVQTDARKRTPVDTGRLRASIRVRFSPEYGGMAADIYTDVEYAPYIHFGTGPAAGHLPFHPPPHALDAWMRRHGLDPALDWVLAQKIGSHGYAPHPFLADAWDAGKQDFLSRLQVILAEG